MVTLFVKYSNSFFNNFKGLDIPNAYIKVDSSDCISRYYEEWDEAEDKKWILTFLVIDGNYEIKPELN